MGSCRAVRAENVDFTNEIIEVLNNLGRATASTRKPAAGRSVTPAGSKTNEALRFASNFKDTRG